MALPRTFTRDEVERASLGIEQTLTARYLRNQIRKQAIHFWPHIYATTTLKKEETTMEAEFNWKFQDKNNGTYAEYHAGQWDEGERSLGRVGINVRCQYTREEWEAFKAGVDELFDANEPADEDGK